MTKMIKHHIFEILCSVSKPFMNKEVGSSGNVGFHQDFFPLVLLKVCA